MDRQSLGRLSRLALVIAVGTSMAACASVQPRYAAYPQGKTPSRGSDQPAPGQKVGKPYQIKGVWYTPKVDNDYDEVGLASWYGGHHQGKPTANGERFDLNRVTAAHKTLPLPSMVEVINLENGKRLKVRVNDRGPFVAGRIIDLSQEAARELGFESKGLAKVRVRYLGAGETRTAMMDARVE